MFSNNDVLKLRAEERMGSAINAGEALLSLGIGIFAIKSKNKVIRSTAWIFVIAKLIDNIRLIVVNLIARKSFLKLIDDEDEREEAEQETSFEGVLQKVSSNYKYQFTGKFD